MDETTNDTPDHGHYVARDGKRVSPFFPDENGAYKWLLDHQGMSTDWAVRYEGYSFGYRPPRDA